MDKFKRILIFELNWLGDILFSLPFLRAIRKAFPDAYIACVVVPRYADLLVNNPWINDIHVLTDNNKLTSLGERIKFTRMIKREKYDTAFFLKPSKTKCIISKLAGIKNRIGFAGKSGKLTTEMDMPEDTIHRADHVLALAAAAGIEKADGTYEYFTIPEDEERLDQILHQKEIGERTVVVFNPGGNWDAKRWPAENYVALAKKILKHHSDVEIVVTGAKKDVGLADTIVNGTGERCRSIAGLTGINELAVFFKRSDIVISADSGPLHLASACKTVTIGLFGPTSPGITGPRGQGTNIVIRSKDVGCVIPCYVDDCDKDFECMRSITVDAVFDAADKVLRGI